MDVREKLVELLKEVVAIQQCGFGDPRPTYETAARYLISHGVTVQEWISVNDRLPEDSGYYLVVYRDKYNGSISIAFDMYVKCGAGEWWASEFTHNITHWMPLPQPPKGE